MPALRIDSKLLYCTSVVHVVWSGACQAVKEYFMYSCRQVPQFYIIYSNCHTLKLCFIVPLCVIPSWLYSRTGLDKPNLLSCPSPRLPKSLLRALAIVVLGTNTSLPLAEPVSLLCSAILQEYGPSPQLDVELGAGQGGDLRHVPYLLPVILSQVRHLDSL